MKHDDKKPAELSDIDELRDAIDQTDEMLLRSLGARFRATKLVGKIKRMYQKPIRDEGREEKMKEKWRQHAKTHGIPQPLALLMLDLILDESRRLQEEERTEK